MITRENAHLFHQSIERLFGCTQSVGLSFAKCPTKDFSGQKLGARVVPMPVACLITEESFGQFLSSMPTRPIAFEVNKSKMQMFKKIQQQTFLCPVAKETFSTILSCRQTQLCARGLKNICIKHNSLAELSECSFCYKSKSFQRKSAFQIKFFSGL